MAAWRGWRMLPLVELGPGSMMRFRCRAARLVRGLLAERAMRQAGLQPDKGEPQQESGEPDHGMNLLP